MQKTNCPYCQKLNASGASYCSSCGKSLEASLGRNPSSGITKLSKALSSKYEIVELIGRGGMANVYKAIHKRLDRMVALKVIHGNLIHDEESLGRFRLEAKSSASLLHPNIVMVYDEGDAEDIVYLALEYLQGEDLNQLLKKNNRIQYNKVIDYIVPIAKALDYVHKRKLVHRDIKSSNIFITKDDRPVLTDFGIAAVKESLEGLTLPGTIIGTPEFMSPEQANDGAIDGRSDLYGLGVVMYQSLTGKVPLRGDTPISTILKITQEIPIPVIQLRPEIPKWLSDIVDKCLLKDPEERFQTGIELSEALLKRGEKKLDVSLPELEKKTIIIRKERQTDDDVFESHVLKGEEFFDNQNYTQAFQFFTDALKIKPEDGYVKDKIKHLNLIIDSINSAKEQKEQTERNYRNFIDKGDSLLKDSNWDEAISLFEKASTLKRFEKYPKRKIAEINERKEQEKLQRKGIDEKLKNIDAFIATNQFNQAQKVLNSLTKEVNNMISQEIITNVSQKLKETKERFEKLEAIDKVKKLESSWKNDGDNISFSDWFKKIKKLEPEVGRFNESKSVLEKFKIQLTEKENKYKEEQIQQKKFDGLLSKARTLITEGLFAKGIELIKSSLEIYPDNEDAIFLLNDAKEKLESEARRQIQVQKLLDKSSEAFDAGEIQNSIEFLEKALEIDPSQNSIKILINQHKKEERKQQLLKQKVKEKKEKHDFEFNKAVEFERTQDYNNALNHYKKAYRMLATEKAEEKIELLTLRVEEYKRKKIEEVALNQRKSVLKSQINLCIETKRLEEAKKKWIELKEISGNQDVEIVDLERNIELGEKTLENWRKFQELLNKSNQAFKNGELEQALNLLKEAAVLFPDNELVKSRIEIINNKIDFESKLLASRKQELGFDFSSLIKRADNLFKQKKYEEAKSVYESAVKLDTKQAYPKQKLKELDYIFVKIEKEKETAKKIDEKFADLIKEGFRKYENKEYDLALKSYEYAFRIKPDQFYLKDRIALIKERINSSGKKSARDETIANFTLKADNLLNEGKYQEARTVYELMLEIDSGSDFPKVQIRKIDAQLQIKKSEKQDADKRELLFNRLVSEADSLYERKEFNRAISNYEKALEYKKTDYVNNKIEIVNFAISAEKRLSEEREKEAIALNNHLLNADRLFQEGLKKEALEVYKIALVHFPKNKLIESKIEEVESYLQLEEARLNQNHKKEGEFMVLLEKSNNSFKKGAYQQSVDLLNKALLIKPNNSAARSQLELITALINEKRSKNKSDSSDKESINNILKLVQTLEKNADFKQALATLELIRDLKLNRSNKSDIAETESRIKRKMISQKKRDKAKIEYEELLAKAFASFKNKDFEIAIDFYQKAVRVNPDSEYPKERIAQIKEIISSQKAQSHTGQIEVSSIKKLAYQLKRKKSYDEAIDSFQLLKELTGDKKYDSEITKLKTEREVIEKTKKRSIKPIENSTEKLVKTNLEGEKVNLGKSPSVDQTSFSKVSEVEQAPSVITKKTSKNNILVPLLMVFAILIGVGASFYNNKPPEFWKWVDESGGTKSISERDSLSQVLLALQDKGDSLYDKMEINNNRDYALEYYKKHDALLIKFTKKFQKSGLTIVNENNSNRIKELEASIEKGIKIDSIHLALNKLQLQADEKLKYMNTKKKAQEAVNVYKNHDVVFTQKKELLVENGFKNHKTNEDNIREINKKIKDFSNYYKKAEMSKNSQPQIAEQNIKKALGIFSKDWAANKLYNELKEKEPPKPQVTIGCNSINTTIAPKGKGKGFWNKSKKKWCLDLTYSSIVVFSWSSSTERLSGNKYYKVKRNGKFGIIRLSFESIEVIRKCSYDGFDHFDLETRTINGRIKDEDKFIKL